jgi:hypothetical protein
MYFLSVQDVLYIYVYTFSALPLSQNWMSGLQDTASLFFHFDSWPWLESVQVTNDLISGEDCYGWKVHWSI